MIKWLLNRCKLVKDLMKALVIETSERRIAEGQVEDIHRALDSEKVRRVAAETIAFAREQEISRLLDQLKEMREREKERMNSLDALNIKLMRENVPEPNPDMSQYHATNKVKLQMVDGVRRIHRQMDEALIGKFYHRGPIKPADELISVESE